MTETDEGATQPGLPSELRAYSGTDVAAQRVPLSMDAWASVFASSPEVAAEIAAEIDAHNGIRRSFIHERADGDPVSLFLAAMAWGFGPTAYGPARVAKMMAIPGFESNVGTIVEDVRTRGAAEGWTSLLLTHKIHGLGMAYGTKLLYFAGYGSDCPGPRPLVLDQFVRAALVRFGAPLAAKGTVWRDDYVNYLTIAERWAADETWSVEPDVVEFGLFDLGKTIGQRAAEVDDDEAEVARGEPNRG